LTVKSKLLLYGQTVIPKFEENAELKIVILGPDGAGKSSVINGLMSRLAQSGHDLKMRHLKPQIIIPQRGEPVAIVADPHGKPPRSALLSVAKIFIWLMEEWYANLFQDRKKTLLICDRYYHDLLIDPLRYRYGGPVWVAILVGKLMPQPDLWMLLDASVEVLQARKQEVPPEETARQRKAYRNFILAQQNHVIIDASQPLEQEIADVEHVVVETMGKNKGHRE
jgi:thymidylate kinase